MSKSRWSNPELVTVASGDSHQPALAVTGDVVHLVWTMDKSLFHARRIHDRWLPPARITAGEEPALMAGADGLLHCIYTSWFLGNCEVYYIRFNGERWGFPEWVSRTTGISTQPALALNNAQEGRIVWSDDTPGRPVIYLAGRGQIAWLHAPIPNASGVNPSIAIAASGQIYVAWQDRVIITEGGKALPGPYQVFCTRLNDNEWSIPEVISTDRAVHAITPRLVVGFNDDVQMVWQQERRGQFSIYHARRSAEGWSPAAMLSEPENDARLPLVSVNAAGCHVFWAEGAVIKQRTQRETDAAWTDAEIVCPECTGLNEVAAATTPAGDMHFAWSAYHTADTRQINYSQRTAPEAGKIFLPIMQAER